MSTEEKILTLEKEALNEWSDGNPVGFAKHAAKEVTYVDDIGAQNRVEGIDAVLNYLKSLEEMIPKHNYEMVNPRVQVHRDCAVLSYYYHPTTLEGEPSTKWRASSVYVNTDEDWKVLHTHWTMLKE